MLRLIFWALHLTSSSHPEIERRQMPIRFMAREGRVRRRLLSESLMGLMRPLRPDEVAARVVLPSNFNDPLLRISARTAQPGDQRIRLPNLPKDFAPGILPRDQIRLS